MTYSQGAEWGPVDGELLGGNIRAQGESGWIDQTGFLLKTGKGDQILRVGFWLSWNLLNKVLAKTRFSKERYSLGEGSGAWLRLTLFSSKESYLQETMACRVKIELFWQTAIPFSLHIVYSCFYDKPEIFAIWLFTEEVFWLLV